MSLSIRGFIFFILIFNKPSFSQDPGCVGGNCMNGIGTFIWESGQHYTGEWVNGRRSGLGVYDWSDGSYYFGYFANGVLEGKGIYIGSEGKTKLIGTFKQGKLVDADNFISSGCLLGNCYNGVGVYLWANNDMYLGNWKSGYRTGYGRFDWSDGAYYTGNFSKGLLEGRGYYVSKDGVVLDGEFKSNNFIDNSTPGSRSATTTQNKSEATVIISGTFSSVCSLLQKVVEGFPNNFEAMKGERNQDRSVFLNVWNATVQFENGRYSELSAGISNENVPFMFSNQLFRSSDFKTAQAKYNSFVEELKNCNYNCCSTAFNEKKSGDTYSMLINVQNINAGFSYSYLKMGAELSLSENVREKIWYINLKVVDLQ